MPIVNYIREHRRFIQYASDEKLTANERLLWYALMEIMNQRADGCVWPDDFIRVGNDRVLTLCPMGFDTMAKARNGLKQRGLIEFKAGDKNKANPAYKMHYFCPEDYPEKSDNSRFYPKFTDNTQDNMRGNTQGNTGGNIRGNAGGNPGDHTQTKTGNKNNIYTKRDFEEDDEDAADIRAGEEDEDPISDRTERAAAICADFIRCFGRRPYPAEVARLVRSSWMMGFTPQMTGLAMEKAAGRSAEKPVDYTLTILDDWKREEVKQPHQIDERELEYMIESGKDCFGVLGTGDSVEDWKNQKAARERRRMENAEAAT